MSNSKYIKSYLSSKFPINITESSLKQLILIVKKYEIRGTHPLALNTPLLGVNQILFLPSDREMLFDLFDKDEKDLKNIIKEIPSIDNDFNVVSDPFNIFCIWVLHNIQIKNGLNKKLRYEASISLLNYFQYRMFSSILQHWYPYKANEEIMSAVIHDLNMKSDINKYKTWRNVIYKRSEDAFSKHHDAIINLEPDNKVLYLITDVQTKMRNQIKKISLKFHEYKDKNNLIRTYTLTTNIDGETIIKNNTFIFDSIASKIFTQMIYGNDFINDKYIILLSKLFKILSPSMIRTMMIKLSEIAKDQEDSNTSEKTVKIKGETYIIGLKSLIREILSSSYKYMINKEYNINNKMMVLDTTKKIFSYSRISSDEILKVKKSINFLLSKLKLSNRHSTLASLGIVVPMYFVLKSFDFIQKK